MWAHLKILFMDRISGAGCRPWILTICRHKNGFGFKISGAVGNDIFKSVISNQNVLETSRPRLREQANWGTKSMIGLYSTTLKISRAGSGIKAL